ncbi:DUF4402 domain-containing protein [Aquisediminimonas sediminicola]|uniref:DUF4402 domain-containing protein n=1 Tax=Alteraquisediminimonas sediminicola TaxID=2676787 RepID=UPI001C8E7402|nr:DUF4402 domain-containing protein [Aquisediminimonas sediminicola]
MRVMTFLVGLAIWLMTAVTPVTAQTVQNNGGLEFGKIAAGAGGASVTISPTGTRTAIGAILISGGTTQAATFTVTGTPLAGYEVTFGTPTPLAGPNSSGMELSGFTTSLPLVNDVYQGTLDGDGTASFQVGATIAVGATQTPGPYVNGSIPVTVNYSP